MDQCRWLLICKSLNVFIYDLDFSLLQIYTLIILKRISSFGKFYLYLQVIELLSLTAYMLVFQLTCAHAGYLE